LFRSLFTPNPATQGYLIGVGGELLVTGATSPLSVAAGDALGYGFWYTNTSAKPLTVATPLNGTTGGHVVVEIDWAAKTGIARAILNTDGMVAIPALTQTAGTRWQYRRATFTITTSGVITVTNLDTPIRLTGRGGAANLDAGSVTSAKLADLAVSTTKLADVAVTTAKLADAAITAVKLAFRTFRIVNNSASTTATGVYIQKTEPAMVDGDIWIKVP
jgi:hypothetical protein